MPTLPTPFVVFGYGSLIFKPPPHTISQTPGFLKGYVRRFAQKSHDHRGTPEVVPFRVSNLLTPAEVFTKNPGRVVTLIHKEEWDKFSDSDAFPDDDTVCVRFLSVVCKAARRKAIIEVILDAIGMYRSTYL